MRMKNEQFLFGGETTLNFLFQVVFSNLNVIQSENGEKYIPNGKYHLEIHKKSVVF